MCTVREFLILFAAFLDSHVRGNRALCAQFVHFLPYLHHFLGSELRGNRVLFAQFVHSLPYMHHFQAPNYAVTACCVHSSQQYESKMFGVSKNSSANHTRKTKPQASKRIQSLDGKSFLKLLDTVETCPKVMFWIRLDTFGYV